MIPLLVPKSLAQFQKPQREAAVPLRVHSPVRSKSTSSYQPIDTRYLKGVAAPLPPKISIDTLITEQKTRLSNDQALEMMAELMQLAPTTITNPKEVTANFVLEQIIEQKLDICSGRGYAKPGMTDYADQWHEVDILGISNDAFRVYFPQLDCFRLAKIHSIIIENLQLRYAPFSLETGVEDIAESSEPVFQDLSEEEIVDLFKLSFKSFDQSITKSSVGVYNVRSSEDIQSFLDSRKRARNTLLANSRVLVDGQQQKQLDQDKYVYPSTLDLSSSAPGEDMKIDDLKESGVSVENGHRLGDDTSEFSVFAAEPKADVIRRKYQQARARDFQFRHFFEEEIPEVHLQQGSHLNDKNTKYLPESSETDLPLSQLRSVLHDDSAERRASVLMSHIIDQKKALSDVKDGSPAKDAAPAEDSSHIVSHSFDILSTLDVIERRDKQGAGAYATNSPNSASKQTDHGGPVNAQNQPADPSGDTITTERVPFQYIDRRNNMVVRDVSRQFLQRMSAIHVYQRMRLSFESALRRLNSLVEEHLNANKPYLGFISTTFIGHTLFYNLKTRLNEDYCIDCVAEIKERRLRLQHRSHDYDLFLNTIKSIKTRAEKMNNTRSKSFCGFTSAVKAAPVVLPSISKDDDSGHNSTSDRDRPPDEDTSEYILDLMRMRQRREQVYDHFESMIAQHNQVRSSAVELCMGAINANKAMFEKLINPTLNRATQFDGIAVLDSLYSSYTEHALRTDFTTEIIEQANRDSTHELNWCARQLLRLRDSSHRRYTKYKYPEYCPKRREAFENARTVLMSNKIFLGTSEYSAVFSNLMSTVHEHLKFLIITPQLLNNLNDVTMPKISDYVFANMVFQADLTGDAKTAQLKQQPEYKSLQKALLALPEQVDNEKSRGSRDSVQADAGGKNKPDGDGLSSARPDANNPILNRPARQEPDNTASTSMPAILMHQKPRNAYEWIQQRYRQIQHNMEQSIIKRREALAQKDAEEAAKSAAALMARDFTYTPQTSSQAEELYKRIFKGLPTGETNFMEILSIYLTNCFILLYEILFPYIQETLMLKFSDLAFEQTRKKILAHCHLIGATEASIGADTIFEFQCQTLAENQVLFRAIQKKVEIMLFKMLYAYVTEDIYPQWSIFILLLFHGADRDMRYIAQSKALASFSQVLKISRFSEEYMSVLRKTHELNVTMAYTKLYEDAEQVSSFTMESFTGFRVPRSEISFTKASLPALQLNQTLADTVVQNVSTLSGAGKKKKNNADTSHVHSAESGKDAASKSGNLTSVQSADTQAAVFNLFQAPETLMTSVQRIQNMTEMHDFIYSQPTEWYFTGRIITDVLYLNKEAEVQFTLNEPHMRKIIALFSNVECVLSSIKNQRGLITCLMFTPSPNDVFSSLPMFVYDLLDFYASYPTFSDNLFPEVGVETRSFGAQYNISTTKDQQGSFSLEGVARLDTDEPLRRVLQDISTMDDSLPIRNGSDLIRILGNNSTLPFNSVHKRIKKADAKKMLLRSNIRVKRSNVKDSMGSSRYSSRAKSSHDEAPGKSRRRARSKLLQYRHRNANPPTVPIRTSQVIPDGDVPFMDMTGKADFATVAGISFNIKTRSTAYSWKVASFFDTHGKVGTYMEARKCNRLHYEPPTILYRLINLAKHAALNLKNYLDMILAFLTRYVKESLRFADVFLGVRDLVPETVLTKNWQVESLLNRMQARIKDYYKAARMTLHATFKDKQGEEKAGNRASNVGRIQDSAVESTQEAPVLKQPRKPLVSNKSTPVNSILGERLIDSSFPFLYEIELISQFLRSETLITALVADYIPGSAPPAVISTRMLSAKSKTSMMARLLLSMYHLYDGFWCLMIMPTECFFGTLRLVLKSVVVRLRHIYEALFLVAASRVEDYIYIAAQAAQRCILAMQKSFNAAKFSTPAEIGTSFYLFRMFIRNVTAWAEYFSSMRDVEDYLAEVAYGTKIGMVYANVLQYRVTSSKLLFSNHGFLPRMEKSLHTVYQAVVNSTEQIEYWVAAASELVFPRIAEMLTLTSHDKVQCDKNFSDFKRRFANSICKNIALPTGIDPTQTGANHAFQQMFYAIIWSQSGLPFLSKKSMQEARLILQQNKIEHHSASPFQFFDRPTTIHPIHLSTVFLEVEDLIKRLIELLQVLSKSNLEILGFSQSVEHKDMTREELLAHLETEGEFMHVDALDYVLFGDSKDLETINTSLGATVDEVRASEIKKKKQAYYHKLLKVGRVIPVKPENVRLIISETSHSASDTVESRLLSLLPLVSLTCKLMLLSDDLVSQITDWFSRPINTIAVQDVKLTVLTAINVALSFLSSVDAELPISSIAHTIFETVSKHRQHFLIMFAVKAALENTQVGFSFDVMAYDTLQPYTYGDVPLDAYLGIDAREPLSIVPYVKDMLARSSGQINDDIVARKAVDMFIKHAADLHFAMNTYCVKTRSDKLIQLQNHEIAMSILCKHQTLLFDSFLLPVFSDPMSEFSLSAEPDLLCTEISKLTDASSYYIQAMKPVVRTSKVKGRTGTGKFIVGTNCTESYTYAPVVARALAHDLHLPPLRLLKFTAAVRSLRKIRYILVGGSERSLWLAMKHYQSDLFTSFASYHTNELFDLEWYSSAGITSYCNTTTGTPFSRPISGYSLCKQETDKHVADQVMPYIQTCLHNAFVQTTDTALQIECASIVEALGFSKADLQVLSPADRITHVLSSRYAEFCSTLSDAFVCSSFYRDAFDNSPAVKCVRLLHASEAYSDLYTQENTIFMHTRCIKDLARLRKLHQGAKTKMRPPTIPAPDAIRPFIASYVSPRINVLITRINHFKYAILRGIYEKNLWLEPMASHLHTISAMLQVLQLQNRAFRELAALNLCTSLNHSLANSFSATSSFTLRVAPENAQKGLADYFLYNPLVRFSELPDSFGQVITDLIIALKHVSISHFNPSLSLHQLVLRKTSRQSLWTICSDIFSAQLVAIETYAHVCESRMLNPASTPASGHRMLFSALVETALYESYYAPIMRPKSMSKVPELNEKHIEPLPFVAIPLPQRIIDAISTLLACCGYPGYEFVAFKVLYPSGAYLYYIDGVLQRSRHAARWTKESAEPYSSKDQITSTRDSVTYLLDVDPIRRVQDTRDMVEYIPFVTPLYFRYLHMLFTSLTMDIINSCLSMSFSYYSSHFASLLQTEFVHEDTTLSYRNEMSYIVRGLPLRITIHVIRRLMHTLRENVLHQHSDTLRFLDNLTWLSQSLREVTQEHKALPFLTFSKNYATLVTERAVNRLARLHGIVADPVTTYCGDPVDITEIAFSVASQASEHPPLCDIDVDSLCMSSSSEDEEDILSPGDDIEDTLGNLKAKMDQKLEQTAHSRLQYNMASCNIDRQFDANLGAEQNNIAMAGKDAPISRLMPLSYYFTIGQIVTLTGFSERALDMAILRPIFTDSHANHIIDTLDELDQLIEMVRAHLTGIEDGTNMQLDETLLTTPSFLDVYTCMLQYPVKDVDAYEAALNNAFTALSRTLPSSAANKQCAPSSLKEIEFPVLFHNEVFVAGGLLGRLGCTPLDVDVTYARPSFRGTRSFLKITELLLTTHFVVVVTPTLRGYSDQRIRNFLETKLPMHTAYSAIWVSLASKAFSAADVLKLLSAPVLVILRDLTSEVVQANLSTRTEELATLFAVILTTRLPGRLILWDPSLVSTASVPLVCELSATLRRSLAAAQLPLSAPYIVMCSEFCDETENDADRCISSLMSMLSGYINLPKVSLDTIRAFSTAQQQIGKASNSARKGVYHIIIAVLASQCTSRIQLTLLLELVSTVIGRDELGIETMGDDPVATLWSLLSEDLWGAELLTRIDPSLTVLVRLKDSVLSNRVARKLSSVSLISLTAHEEPAAASSDKKVHTDCSTHILRNVLIMAWLPRIVCPGWIEQFYEQFYGVNCRAILPLSTKGWSIMASMAYSVLNRTDNLVHGLYLGLTDLKSSSASSPLCSTLVEKTYVQPLLMAGYDLLTDSYTTDLLVLSLIRILTDIQLAENVLSLKEAADSIEEGLYALHNRVNDVPVVRAICVIRGLTDLQMSATGEVILNQHSIYILVIPEQHISVSSDRYYELVRIATAHRSSTTRLIVLSNCRAIYQAYVELGIAAESPLIQAPKTVPGSILNHAHLLYEFAAKLTYRDLVEQYYQSKELFVNLDSSTVSATAFEETLSSFVFTLDHRGMCVNLAECFKVLMVTILYIPLNVYQLSSMFSMQSLSGVTTVYLYLLQLYSLLVAKPKLESSRACMYPHYSFECNMDFMLLIVSTSKSFADALAYIIALLFSFATTATKIFLLSTTDHLFSRDALASKTSDDPDALLAKYHNKYMDTMIQMLLLEREKKSQYEAALNKISAEFNFPLFECTQALSQYFRGITQALNAAANSSPLYVDPYLFLLPQFRILCISRSMVPGSYECLLAIRDIVDSCYCTRPDTVAQLRKVSFEMVPLPYPEHWTSTQGSIDAGADQKADILVYEMILQQYRGLRKVDHKGCTLAYYLAAASYFCKPICLVASLFAPQNLIVLKYAYPLIKQDCSTRVHSDYIMSLAMSQNAKGGLGTATSTSIIAPHAHFRVAKLFLHDESDIRTFLFRHQHWFCLIEGSKERLAIAFVRTVILVEVVSPDTLVSGFLSSFAYNMLVQMPDSLGYVMVYRMVNVCPILLVSLNDGQKPVTPDSLQYLRCLYCPYIMTDCYERPRCIGPKEEGLTYVQQILLYLMQTGLYCSFGEEDAVRLCRRIMALKAPQRVIVPFLQALSQLYALHLYSNELAHQQKETDNTQKANAIDRLFEFACFHQFGLQQTVDESGSSPQHIVEFIMVEMVPLLSVGSSFASLPLASAVGSEQLICPTFSQNCLLHTLAIHINSIHMRNLFNRIAFHYSGKASRHDKLRNRIRQTMSSFSSDNLASTALMNKGMASFSLELMEKYSDSASVTIDRLLGEKFTSLYPRTRVEKMLCIPYMSGLQTPISVVTTSYLSYDEYVFILSRLTCSEVKVPISAKKATISSVLVDLGGLCHAYPLVDTGADQNTKQFSTRDRVLIGIRAAIGSILRLSPSGFVPVNARQGRTDTYALRSTVSYHDEQKEFYIESSTSGSDKSSGYYLFDTSSQIDEYSNLFLHYTFPSPSTKLMSVFTAQAITSSNIQDVHSTLYNFVGGAQSQGGTPGEYNRVMLVAPLSLLLGTNTLRIIMSLGEMSSSSVDVWLPLEVSDILADFTSNTSVLLPTIPLLSSIITTKLSIFIFDDLNIMRVKAGLPPDLQRLRSMASLMSFQDYSHIAVSGGKLLSFNLNYFYTSEAFGDSVCESNSSEGASPLLSSDIQLNDEPAKVIPLLPADLLAFNEPSPNSTNPDIIILRLRCSHLLRYLGKIFGPEYVLPQNILLAIVAQANESDSLLGKSRLMSPMHPRSQLKSTQRTRIIPTKSSLRALSSQNAPSLDNSNAYTEIEPIELNAERQLIARRILTYCNLLYRTLATGSIRETLFVVPKQTGVRADKGGPKADRFTPVETEHDSVSESSCCHSETSGTIQQGCPSANQGGDIETFSISKETLDLLSCAVSEFTVLQHYISFDSMISLARTVSYAVHAHYTKQQLSVRENMVALENLRKRLQTLQKNYAAVTTREKELDDVIQKNGELVSQLMKLEVSVSGSLNFLMSRKEALSLELDAQLGDTLIDLVSHLSIVEDAVVALFHLLYTQPLTDGDLRISVLPELMGLLFTQWETALQTADPVISIVSTLAMFTSRVASVVSAQFSADTTTFLEADPPTNTHLGQLLHQLGRSILQYQQNAAVSESRLNTPSYAAFCESSMLLSVTRTAVDLIKEKIRNTNNVLDASEREKAQLGTQYQLSVEDGDMRVLQENLATAMAQRTEDELQYRRMIHLSALHGTVISACILFGFQYISLFTTILNAVFGKNSDTPLCRGCQVADCDSFCYTCRNCRCFCRCTLSYQPDGSYTFTAMPVEPLLCADIINKEYVIDTLSQVFSDTFLTKPSISYRLTLGHTALLEYMSCVTLSKIPARLPIYVSGNILHSTIAEAVSGSSGFTTMTLRSGTKLLDDTEHFYKTCVNTLLTTLGTRAYETIFIRIDTINWKALDLIGALTADLKQTSMYGTVLSVVDHDFNKFRFGTPVPNYKFFVTWGPEIAEVFQSSSSRLSLPTLFAFSQAGFVGSHLQSLSTCILNSRAIRRQQYLSNSMMVHRENLSSSILPFFLPAYFTELTNLRLEQDGLIRQASLSMKQSTLQYTAADEMTIANTISDVHQQLSTLPQYTSSLLVIEKKIDGLMKQRDECTRGSDSVVSTAIQTLFAFTNYLARLSMRYPTVARFWTLIMPDNIRRVLDTPNTLPSSVCKGPFYIFLLHIFLPLLSGALPVQQYYLTALTLLVMGEAAKRGASPSIMTAWNAILKASGQDLDEAVAKANDAVAAQSKPTSIESNITALLEIIASDGAISPQLVDFISPILSEICPRCTVPLTDYDIIRQDTSGSTKGSSNALLLFADDPLVTCNILARKLLLANRAVRVLSPWAVGKFGTSASFAWTGKLMELEDMFYMDASQRSNPFANLCDTPQTSALSGVTIVICTSIDAVRRMIDIMPEIFGKVVVVVWSHYAEFDAPHAVTELAKILVANPALCCMHSRGHAEGQGSNMSYAPPLASLTRGHLYGLQRQRDAFKHHPLADLNVALDVVLDLLNPITLLPATTFVYLRLERLSFINTVGGKALCDANSIIEGMLFLRRGVASKLSIATIMQYRYSDLLNLLDGSLFKRIALYVLEPLQLPPFAHTSVLLQLLCLWLFVGHFRKEDTAALIEQFTPIHLSKTCRTYCGGYILPQDQLLQVFDAFGVFVTSRQMEWIYQDITTLWYRANTIPKHSVFMGRAAKRPTIAFWSTLAQPYTPSYPVTYTVVDLPTAQGQVSNFYARAARVQQSELPNSVNDADQATTDDASVIEGVGSLVTSGTLPDGNDSSENSLLAFIPVDVVTLLSNDSRAYT